MGCVPVSTTSPSPSRLAEPAPKYFSSSASPLGRLLGDHRDAQDAARAVGMPGPLIAIDELGRQVLTDEEADHRHVGLGNAHRAELGVLGLARDLDRAVEEQRRIGLQARRLEGVEGQVGAVGRQRHVG